MIPSVHSRGFVQRYLDPGDWLAEFICGLIMVLTFTLGAGLTVADGPDATTNLLIAAIGCNVAWGIIDGVLYILTAMSERSSRIRFITAVRQQADNDAAALAVIRAEVDERLRPLGTQQTRDALCRDILVQLRSESGATEALAATKARAITAEDIGGAVAIFWIELLACVPAVLPFVILPYDHHFALRVSNGLLIVMLFVVGQQWARVVQLNRLLVGLLMAGIGLALVGVAMLLGG